MKSMAERIQNLQKLAQKFEVPTSVVEEIISKGILYRVKKGKTGILFRIVALTDKAILKISEYYSEFKKFGDVSVIDYTFGKIINIHDATPEDLEKLKKLVAKIRTKLKQ